MSSHPRYGSEETCTCGCGWDTCIGSTVLSWSDESRTLIPVADYSSCCPAPFYFPPTPSVPFTLHSFQGLSLTVWSLASLWEILSSDGNEGADVSAGEAWREELDGQIHSFLPKLMGMAALSMSE